MSHHEQCGRDEVWLGNTDKEGDHYKWLLSKGLKTLRLGKVAYDIYGKPLKDEEGYRPVFINRIEEQKHNDLMMELTFGQNWRRG